MAEHRGDDLILDWSGLEVLGPEECMQLLNETAVGRIGFVERGGPVILPVNFAVDGRAVVFKSGEGSKLAAALMQEPVCLEVDSWNTMDHTGWSVLARGVADVVLDESETDRLDMLPVQPWTRPDLRWHWVRVMIEDLTGRRILPH